MATASFDRRFDRWMQEPEFAESYALHRARIDAIDALMHALDDERERRKMTKADLARRIEAEPAAIRRLFTEARPNPQIGRLVDMAHELGLEITLTRRRRRSAATRSNVAAAPG
jgi:ribosome-binding protein aMBF1 (putative translation factor)